MLLKTIAGVITEMGGKWLERRNALIDAEIEAARLRQRHLSTMEIEKLKHDIQWDVEQVQSSRTSWKDELWTIVLVSPLVMAFIPGLQPYVGRGFEVISQSPDWYLTAVGIAIAAAFGVRSALSLFTKRK